MSRAPLRVAFVGQRTYFEACALHDPAGGLDPAFVDWRGGTGDPGVLLALLRDIGPDVVVVFRPEIVPPGLFADLDAVTLGFQTEPLPRGRKAHPDLEWRLSEFVRTDPANFDRVVAFDPVSAPAADAHLPIWRCLPLPVADDLFAPVRPPSPEPRVLFVGYSTEHRERYLTEAKHLHDIVHVAHGLFGARLREAFARTDAAINLHGHPYPSFENRVCLHLAAGHLLLSEPLDPLHGLEPGIDFLELRGPWDLELRVRQLREHPGAHGAVRVRGRLKAERFRASRVWPRLVGDLLRDLDAFGGRRGRGGPHATPRTSGPGLARSAPAPRARWRWVPRTCAVPRR